MIFLTGSMMAAGWIVQTLASRGRQRAREAGESRDAARLLLIGRVGAAMTLAGLAGVGHFVIASVPVSR